MAKKTTICVKNRCHDLKNGTEEIDQVFDRYHQGGHAKYDLDGI